MAVVLMKKKKKGRRKKKIIIIIRLLSWSKIARVSTRPKLVEAMSAFKFLLFCCTDDKRVCGIRNSYMLGSSVR
jgi:hypothetical protein